MIEAMKWAAVFFVLGSVLAWLATFTVPPIARRLWFICVHVALAAYYVWNLPETITQMQEHKASRGELLTHIQMHICGNDNGSYAHGCDSKCKKT